jgi:catechol 2,3-dioxygenase-like lactoylglutathione lyase family enzyme
MIRGLFETHLEVASLERSIAFYTDSLGLTLAHTDPVRKAAFFWISKPQEAMLGIWESTQPVSSRHIAFRCAVEDILLHTEAYLQRLDLKPYNFLQDGTARPMVFAWMPALSLYFRDPDGHELEFIAILEGEGRPDLGILSYEEWKAKVQFPSK